VNRGQLEIGLVKPTDSGLYSCTVQSFLGNHSAYFIINVRETSCKSLEMMNFYIYISKKQFSVKMTHFVIFEGYG